MKKKFLAISGITLLGGVLVYATKRFLEFKEEMDMVDEIEEKDELIESLADDVSYIKQLKDLDTESPIMLNENSIKELYKIHEHLSAFICYIDKFETVSIIREGGKDLIHIKMNIRTVENEDSYVIDMVTDNFMVIDIVTTKEDDTMYSIMGASPRIWNDYSKIDMPAKFFVPTQITKVSKKTVTFGSVKAMTTLQDLTDMHPVIDMYATKNDLEDINTTLNALKFLVKYIPHIMNWHRQWITGKVDIISADIDDKSAEIIYTSSGIKCHYILVFDDYDHKTKSCEMIKYGEVRISGTMTSIDSRGRMVLWNVAVDPLETSK